MDVSHIHFLVVDDMLTMRKIVAQQLKGMGATILSEANDGSTAWEKLEADPSIKFVVSDWNMPIMKGLELLKKCRADSRFKDIAFILVTAEAEMQQVKEALVSGVDNYVVKPFTPQALQEKIQAVVFKRKL